MVAYESGRPAEALEHLSAALTSLGGMQTELPAVEAGCHLLRGRALTELGRPDEARAALDQSLALAEGSGLTDTAIDARATLAAAHHRAGRPREALRLLHGATQDLVTLVRGLGDEEGARVRDRWMKLYEGGFRAARAVDDVGEALYFLESSRAGLLRASLGGREAIFEAVVPDELRENEAKARAAERVARARLRTARERGTRAEAQTRRQELLASRRELVDAIHHTQRRARMAADLVYADPASRGQLTENLGPHTALVQYAVFDEDAFAIVMEGDDARIVDIGSAAELRVQCRDLLLSDPEVPPENRARDLAERLVTPLGLAEETTRVLVSPQGELAYVPFQLLLGDRDVAYVPSGTTLHLLYQEPATGGEKVLALGDPDYDVSYRASTVAYTRGGRLMRLPGTRAEVEAIGDVVLLGREATPERLREALAARPAWRAVHLACHGLVSPDEPMLSALALTGDYLTVGDLLHLRVHADLAVLSACETARGGLFQSEGVVGLARAFMHAGAPRVIVSLWPVDDEATRALMGAFYARWKEGKMPTAKALREAQAEVAADPRWRHPHYWAAWQLWGLPE